jgi:hypothetical protein
MKPGTVGQPYTPQAGKPLVVRIVWGCTGTVVMVVVFAVAAYSGGWVQ